MGSFKENRTLSILWDKLQSLLGYSGVSNPWLANTTIDEPLTLYVETTGTTTLAAMRALSPKAFPATPNVYGTVVYE